MFGLRRRNLVGVDIDTQAVRMVQLRQDDAGYTVTGARSTEIAPWGDDPDLRRIHTIRAIRQGLSECRIDGKLAVCALRGPEVVVRAFDFPALPDEEIGPAVGLEASQICPFSTDESTLDYQVTSSDTKKTRGFWVAANNGLIRSTRELVQEAGLRCAMIDVAGLALLNCLENSADARETTEDGVVRHTRKAVLDIGGSCTTVAIVDQAGRPFVRDIGTGSDDILRKIATRAGVPLETARTALLNHGPERNPADNMESTSPGPSSNDEVLLWNHLEEACAELIGSVGTTLRYYAAQHGSGLPAQGNPSGCSYARIEKLLVCGAFAGIEQFIELLRANLYIDVASWNPFDSMRNEATQASDPASGLQEAESSMALATGLAMRHI